MKYEKMTPADLKTGMIVTWRSGEKATVLRDTPKFGRLLDTDRDFLVRCSGDGWTTLANYNDDFTNKFVDRYDIVKVEVPDHHYDCFDYERDNFNSKVVWEEKTTVKMTVAEIEKKLGYKIEIVSEEE